MCLYTICVCVRATCVYLRLFRSYFARLCSHPHVWSIYSFCYCSDVVVVVVVSTVATVVDVFFHIYTQPYGCICMYVCMYYTLAYMLLFVQVIPFCFGS